MKKQATVLVNQKIGTKSIVFCPLHMVYCITNFSSFDLQLSVAAFLLSLNVIISYSIPPQSAHTAVYMIEIGLPFGYDDIG